MSTMVAGLKATQALQSDLPGSWIHKAGKSHGNARQCRHLQGNHICAGCWRSIAIMHGVHCKHCPALPSVQAKMLALGAVEPPDGLPTMQDACLRQDCKALLQDLNEADEAFFILSMHHLPTRNWTLSCIHAATGTGTLCLHSQSGAHQC